MSNIQLTLVFGPFAATPYVQASAPVAPNGGIFWTTAAAPGAQPPVGVSPPVIS